ncbi:MAG: hypothetical protein F6J98_03645 [Moorea sp. SIO4G2]|nr:MULTISPECIES: hypothetical protein [Moorena]NEO59545.1 hypothetical protein [Moorena sp. SIO4G2]NEP27054.1 hypothetical protein [Moorena sp. SIO3I6]
MAHGSVWGTSFRTCLDDAVAHGGDPSMKALPPQDSAALLPKHGRSSDG